jgi:type I restriction-modification system DNA methylase subunit
MVTVETRVQQAIKEILIEEIWNYLKTKNNFDKVNTDFKQTLWKTADSLRAQMDAAEYKHIVLGLIFLKYISDSFAEQKEKIKEMVTDPKSDFFISEDLKISMRKI